MKKLAVFLLAVLMCLTLCACGKSEAAIACEELAAQIGEVTLDSESAIVAAENAYAALSDKEKEQVENAAVITAGRAAYDELVKLDGVKKLVEAIGEVNAESEAAIIAAEEAYAALTDAEKGKIAESGDALAKSREAYTALVVKEVTDAIDAIGTVTLDSGIALAAAEELYNALAADLQPMVTNKGALDAAKDTFEALKAAEKERVLNEVSSKFRLDADKVTGITWYYPKDLPRYIDIRSYIIPYVGNQGKNSWLVIRYNYTDRDDWIFWENLTIVADGQKFYKFFNYFDIVRDNDTEVWEYYDEPLYYNQGFDTEDLKMLEAIASSEETIIRFQGDDYSYDLIVSKADKAMIRDALDLYGALIG